MYLRFTHKSLLRSLLLQSQDKMAYFQTKLTFQLAYLIRIDLLEGTYRDYYCVWILKANSLTLAPIYSHVHTCIFIY